MMDHQMYRRQQQPRSNSIGDHELALAANHQRLKQSIYPHQSPYIDANQYYNQRLRHHVAGDRSLSPMNFGGRDGQDLNLPQRSSSIKYSLGRQQVRNQLHASLECLNIAYSEQATDQKQLQQSFTHQYHQQPQTAYPYSTNPYPPTQNQHYAANYVLTPASAETVISQNGDQDLAAAAMENPAQAHYRRATSISSSYNGALPPPPISNYQGHTLMSQVQAPLWQSPMHRKISAQGQSIMSHGSTNTSSNPMRAGHSSLSLASSTYLIEDKLQHEIKKLESELKIEKEKNEALNSQLSINSNLMAAFEQSLNTLNSRVRQLSALNERKDKELEELREQLKSGSELYTNSSQPDDYPSSRLPRERQSHTQEQASKQTPPKPVSGCDNNSEAEMHKVIEDLRRQLIEKDRLLTDTRLEALSAAHQLEQLESRLNRDQSIVVNEEDLDEGVLVVNHSPSDSEVVSDSAHFSSELNSQMSKANENQQAQHFYRQKCLTDATSHSDVTLFAPNRDGNSNNANSNNTSSLSNSNNSAHSPEDPNEQQQHHFHFQTHQDNHSNHSSSDYHGGDDDDTSPADNSNRHRQPMDGERNFDRYNDEDSEAMNRLLDIMLVGTN